MKRKIIKIADKTLVVSLPTSWIDENNIQKGDELDLTYLDDKILLSPNISSQKIKKTSIDISNINERILRWKISSLHKQGFDEIIVLNYTEQQLNIIKELLQNLFIGFIIKEKTKLKIVVGQIAITDASEFNSTLRRSFRQLISATKDLLESFKTRNELVLSNLIHLEHENNKLTNFCERLLNKTLKEKEKGHFWYVIVWNLEKIMDNFKHISKYYLGKIPEPDDEITIILTKLKEYVEEYYECFYDFSFEKLTKLSEKNKEIEQEILTKMNENNKFTILLHYSHILLIQIADFSASLIALKNKG